MTSEDSSHGEPEVLNASPAQIYAGYEPEDIPILHRYGDQSASVLDDHYVDGFGVRTLYECVPFLDPVTLRIERLQLPVPDDGFHAEAIEYVSLLDALARAERSGRFCSVEIGTGWGPWLGMAGVLACRRNFEEIELIGVEADEGRFELLRRHLAANGLRPVEETNAEAMTNRVFTRLFRGAIWTHDGSVWFPKANLADMGTAAVVEKALTDYRGIPVDYLEVSCLTLETLLEGIGIVDFVHIDVQGVEFNLLSDQIDWVEANVRACMIATHSRTIEGALIELLIPRGWKLFREKPCRVDWNKDHCLLPGRTVVDGSQYWLNLRLID